MDKKKKIIGIVLVAIGVTAIIACCATKACRCN